mgnify:CR=1 FL=1
MEKFPGKDRFFKDNIKPNDFRFNEKVANIFDDMISRSVPFYQETQQMTLSLATRFAQKKTKIYDIGCSTGNVLKGLYTMIPDNSIELIGIDNSPAMLDQSRGKLATIEKGTEKRIKLVFANISKKVQVENASVVIMNYTLQFVPTILRQTVVGQIYDGLIRGGCLILVEKILGNSNQLDQVFIDLYYRYKRKQGYSEKEIIQKHEALKDFLIPNQMDENISLLKKCGFKNYDIFFKWYNFAGFLAIK